MSSKMWFDSEASSSSSSNSCEELLFNDLFNEIKSAAELSYTLRCRLERCDQKTRKSVCSMVRDGCSPLFLASKRAKTEIVEYLAGVCGAEIEQRGLYEFADDKSVHQVTPLWGAAVTGNLDVVRLLILRGADVNAVSDTGSTAVRSACFMSHLDVVKFLVASGADIQKPNFNGNTCLINSVQSVHLCAFLLQNGADVNAQDIQNKTALHYAILDHRLETTKLLLQYGGNPFLVNRDNDDALQTACLKGAAEIFTYLIENVDYSAERVASALELLGSTFVEGQQNYQKALQSWRAACDIRERYGIEKPTQSTTHPFIGGTGEFASRDELEAAALDLDAMHLQSLLICERTLGTSHRDLIRRLIYAYDDAPQHQLCINLWKYALSLRVTKDSILYCDTSFLAQALAKLFLKVHTKTYRQEEQQQQQQGELIVDVDDILWTLDLLLRDLGECKVLLAVSPQHRGQQDSFDKTLRAITHLLLLATLLPPALGKEGSRLYLRRKLHLVLVQVDPRDATGNSLLHLSVRKDNAYENLLEEGNDRFPVFPDVAVAKLLLECGADANAVNHEGSTPLHLASTTCNYSQELVEILLDGGAHIDLRNSSCQKPSEMLKSIEGCTIRPVQYQSLGCLAASAVREFGLRYEGLVPDTLDEFIKGH